MNVLADPNTPRFWGDMDTAQRKAAVLPMLDDGLTCRQIAHHLGATKNAVNGFLRRRDMPKPAAPPLPLRSTEGGAARLAAVSKRVPSVPAPTCEPVGFFELDNTTCRHPRWPDDQLAPDVEDQRYCGAPANYHKTGPYCAYCRQLAYVARRDKGASS